MLFGTIAVLYFAREILIPLAFALILTFVLSPVVALLERLRIGRAPSVAVTVLVAMAAAGCVGWIIAVQLVDVAEEIPRYRQNIHAKMEALRLPTTGPFGLAANSLREIGSELSSLGAPLRPRRAAQIGDSAVRRALPRLLCLSQIVPQPASGLDYLREMVQPVLRPLAMAGLVLIFTVFMLAKRFDLRNRLFRLVGTRPDQHDDASARRRGATCQPVPVDADSGQCLLWNSVRIRSVLDWRAQSRAMGSRRRHPAHRAVCRHHDCRRVADRTLAGGF